MDAQSGQIIVDKADIKASNRG